MKKCINKIGKKKKFLKISLKIEFIKLIMTFCRYNRDWRYHKEERVWITRAPGMAPVDKGPNYERGTYFYFDAQVSIRNHVEQ